MRFPTRDNRKSRLYAIGIAVCVCALSLAVWNGLHRGHGFIFGLFTNTVIGISMAVNFYAERRKPNPHA